MKKFFIFIVVLFCLPISVKSQNSKKWEDFYYEQAKSSDIQKIYEALPQNCLTLLNKIGIDEINPAKIYDLNFKKIIKVLSEITGTKVRSPLTTVSVSLGILIISATIKNLKDSKNSINNSSSIINSITTLCLCANILIPIISFINSVSIVIKALTDFSLCITPVLGSIMIVSGKPLQAASYQTLILFAGQVISYITGKYLSPITNIILGIALISSISSHVNAEHFCFTVQKLIKNILKFTASIFTGILALQNIVSSKADSMATNTLKLSISSFVPIVGNAISDAFTTMYGCIDLLKVGVGAFGIIAGSIILLPSIIECLIWNYLLSICEFIADILELKKIKNLFKSINNVISISFAIILYVAMILIVSTAIILTCGG